MNTNKRICIIMLDVTEDYRDNYIIGVEKQADKFGYQTVTFSIPLLDELHTKKEEEIYQMIDFSGYDGVIFFENSFSAHKSLGNMVENLLAKNCNTPVVVIGESRSYEETFRPDNTIGAKSLTDHVIEKHGCQTLYFLGGEPNQILKNELGFIQSLKEHNIPCTNDNLLYGGYWSECGESLAKDIAYNMVEKPDAVICQDDTVAFFFIKALYRYGIRVPDDIIVTGLGARADSRNNILSITTYPSNAEYCGRKAMSRLHSLITDSEELPILLPKSSVITGMSCGCGDCLSSAVRRQLEQDDKRRTAEIHYHNSELEEKLYTCTDYKELHPIIYHSEYLIKSASFLSVNIAETETTSRSIYMTDHAWSDTPVLFESKNLYPSALPKQPPQNLYVLPMTFAGRFIGHVVVGYDNPEIYDTILKRYVSRLAISVYLLKYRPCGTEAAALTKSAVSDSVASAAPVTDTIFIKKENSLIKVPLENIFYFESEGRKTVAVMKSGRFETGKTLAELESMFSDKNFFRVSKSAIVNLSKVVGITPDADRTLIAAFPGKATVRVSRMNSIDFKNRVKTL